MSLVAEVIAGFVLEVLFVMDIEIVATVAFAVVASVAFVEGAFVACETVHRGVFELVPAKFVAYSIVRCRSLLVEETA